MPEPRRHGRRLGWLMLAVLALPALISIAAPAAMLAAPPDPDKCTDASQPPVGAPRVCNTGVDLGGAVPIVGAVLAGGVLALIAAYLVLRRRASGPFVPADPGEWWLCPTCGSTNVIGSPRCYKCGTWQR